jgi:alkylated DNA nucleotide flippase Atl1
MSNKQNSVEWLISQLQKSKDWHRVLNELSQMSSARVDILEQAKAMHKEEIKQAYEQGYMDKDFSFYQADDYYHQKYNNEV